MVVMPYRLLVHGVTVLAVWLAAPSIALADEEPAAEQLASEEPAREQPTEGQPPGAQPSGEQPAGEQPSGERPSGEQPSGKQPSGGQPSEERPGAPPDQPAGAPPAVGSAADPAAAGSVSDTELDRRAPDQQLAASLTAADLRELSGAARTKVVERLQAKMLQSSDARMERIGDLIGWFALAGLLLLATPLVLRRRYPDRGLTLFKYSVLAAVTFFVTVNLFGIVMLGFRAVQSALGEATNPQLSIVNGFFDSIDRNADDYAGLGKELFAPTLAQLGGDTDQPTVALIENGAKLVNDAQVFVTVANLFKKLEFLLAALPIVLVLVTMALFLVALWPTLLEIVRLPMTAAGGQARAARTVVRRTFRHILGELLATLCTLGVLVVLTSLSGLLLTAVVDPALDALLQYFQLGILYLQFVERASSAAVFTMLFSVILFLVLNVVVVIASLTLYLGKAQKIFQRRFNGRVPLRQHRRFWGWGTVAIAAAQLIPLAYLTVAGFALDKLNDRLTDGAADASQIPWTTVMLSGPLLLVVGFLVVFWAARGVKALGFLARYKVPPAPPSAGQ